MSIKTEELHLQVNQLNSLTKHQYMVRFQNGYCGIYVRLRSRIQTVYTGLTKRQCYAILLSMTNMMEFENMKEN